MRKIHDRAVSAGCFSCFLAFLGAIVWTVIDGWSHSIWIAVALGLGLLLVEYSRRRVHRVVQNLIDSAFTSRGIEAPRFKLAGGYGYPGYQLSFSSMEAEQAALSSGALTAFKAGIQDYHRDDGPPTRPFDVEQAVKTTYPNKATDSQIDGAILAAAESHWKKVAMIIVTAADACPNDLPDGDSLFRCG